MQTNDIYNIGMQNMTFLFAFLDQKIIQTLCEERIRDSYWQKSLILWYFDQFSQKIR